MNRGKEMAEKPTAEEIREIAYGFQRSRILLTAYQLGLFEAIGEEKMSAEKVASRIGADVRATDRLLRALCAIGLVELDGERFLLSENTRRLLLPSSPEYMHGLGHAANQYANWGTLTRAVKAGTSVLELTWDGDSRRESFIAAMHDRGVDQARRIAPMLDLQDGDRILDVGGGSGVFSMEFCRSAKDIQATVLDLPDITPLTRRYVAEEGMSECIDIQDGDYLTVSFGTGYDIVFFSAILHINSPRENSAIISKAAKALDRGGRIVVSDFIMDENRVNPARGAVFALNMLVNTSAGDTYTQAEVTDWLKDAGCSEVSRRDTGPSTALLIGHLPS